MTAHYLKYLTTTKSKIKHTTRKTHEQQKTEVKEKEQIRIKKELIDFCLRRDTMRRGLEEWQRCTYLGR